MTPYYEQDGITIYHADCRDVLPTLEPVDLVLTDPPYLHKTGMSGGGFASATRFYRDGALDGMNDFDLDKYASHLLDASSMLVAFHNRTLIPQYSALAVKHGLKYDLHVWHKTNAIPFTNHSWKSDIEYLALIWSKTPGWCQVQQHRHSKVYTSPINPDSLHPAAKPIPLLVKYIEILDAATILDPFMGSGTTLRAAKDLGRKAIGIENKESYCEIAVNRLRQGVLF